MVVSSKNLVWNGQLFRAGESLPADHPATRTSTPVEVTEPVTSTPVEVVTEPVPSTPVEVAETSTPVEVTVVDALRAQAAALGIKVDRRWGEARLRDEINRAGI